MSGTGSGRTAALITVDAGAREPGGGTKRTRPRPAQASPISKAPPAPINA